MDAAKLSFLQNDLVKLFATLVTDSKNSWGKMNAQQMIEHTTAFFDVSAERLNFDLVTPEEHLPKYKEFLLSDKEFRENTKAPASVLGEEPLPLQYASMKEALLKLQQSIENFVGYFENDPVKKTIHPVFGPLNFEEWVALHYKHVRHHLRQFGLI